MTEHEFREAIHQVAAGFQDQANRMCEEAFGVRITGDPWVYLQDRSKLDEYGYAMKRGKLSY